MANDIHLEFILSAPPERVMELLTDAQLMEAWSDGEVVFDPKVGVHFSMFGGWVSGIILKIGADELAYTWTTTDWPEGTTPSEVHYKLIRENDETKIVLAHTGLPDEKEMQSHEEGWFEHFFWPLEEYILVDTNN
jgi:uncharacterized protein YndB with AHSA1/START domain